MKRQITITSIRTGVTILEVSVSAAITAMLLALLTQMIVQSKRHAQRVEDRFLSMAALQNALETVASMDWDEIDDDALASVTLPEELRARWPAGRLTGEVTTLSEPSLGKRVVLKLSCDAATEASPVVLATWIWRREEAGP